MIPANYARIAAAIEHGRGSQLIVVMVPPVVSLLLATNELQLYLLSRGIDAHPVNVAGHQSLMETVETVTKAASHQVIIVYGLEALSVAHREVFLRASSFARARLRKATVPIILVLGTETWSWLGMELPDLARWSDGPFLVPGEASGVGFRPSVHVRLSREALGDSPVLLEDHRNVDLRTLMWPWIEKGGVLVLGGAPGVGLTNFAVHAEARCKERGKQVVWTDEIVDVDGTPMLVPASGATAPLSFEEWLEHQTADVIIARRAFSAIADRALLERGRSGLVAASTKMALMRSGAGITRLYVPPIQVVEPGGKPHADGLEAAVQALRVDIAQQLDFDVDALLEPPLLATLAYASGGLPGVMWTLIARADERSRRLGTRRVSAELIRSVIQDVASATIPATSKDDIDHAVRHNLLDLELEARGAVLFYVIGKELRTLRNPLLDLARPDAPIPIG